MAGALLAGVVPSEKVGEVSLVAIVEFWFVLGGSWVFCRVSEALKVVSGFSAFGLSDLLAQLTDSKAVRISRLKARKLRARGSRFISI